MSDWQRQEWVDLMLDECETWAVVGLSGNPDRTAYRIAALLQRRGKAERVASDLEIFQAKSVPPQTTRARLRGEFIRKAQERRRDFTVDWVHLKLNDQAQRTVLCKDPFRSVDDRVEKLIASM